MGESIPEEDARGKILSTISISMLADSYLTFNSHLETGIYRTTHKPTICAGHHRPLRKKQMNSEQIPSHRKLCWWNNDRFIGTHMETSGVIHPVVVREGEEWYQKYWMPNYPREYCSEFAR